MSENTKNLNDFDIVTPSAGMSLITGAGRITLQSFLDMITAENEPLRDAARKYAIGEFDGDESMLEDSMGVAGSELNAWLASNANKVRGSALWWALEAYQSYLALISNLTSGNEPFDRARFVVRDEEGTSVGYAYLELVSINGKITYKITPEQ